MSALVEQLEMEKHQVFTVTCTAHLVTILSSRQVIQEILDLLFDKCLEESLELSELRVMVKFAATKHFELVLNKLETLSNSSATKKNKFLKFIKEKLNEEKKGRDNTLFFSCLGEAIENSPLKELEFCAEGVTKKFLHPFLSSVKDFKDKSLESALDCLKILSDMSLKIMGLDDRKFQLSQKDELLYFVLAILQHESASEPIKIAAIKTLTSMTHLPPHVGQLTRYSILQSTFMTFFSTNNEDVRRMIDEMLAQFSAQDSHASVVEEIFSLLEDKILGQDHQTGDALDILLVALNNFFKSATKEEKFSPAMLGVIISKCFHEDTEEVAKKCFQVLVRIYAFGRDMAMKENNETETGISDSIIKVFSSEDDLSVLLTTLCDHLTRGDIAEVIPDIVTATKISVLTIPGLITKISGLQRSLMVGITESPQMYTCSLSQLTLFTSSPPG